MDEVDPRPSTQPAWWRPLLLGTPTYWSAFVLSWSIGTILLLVFFAVVLSRPAWLQPVLAAGAFGETAFALLMLNVLRRAARVHPARDSRWGE